MSLNFNKYKKVAAFMFLGLFVSLFSFLSAKDKTSKTYSIENLSIAEKVMADVPGSNNTPNNPGDVSDGDGDGGVGDESGGDADSDSDSDSDSDGGGNDGDGDGDGN